VSSPGSSWRTTLQGDQIDAGAKAVRWLRRRAWCQGFRSARLTREPHGPRPVGRERASKAAAATEASTRVSSKILEGEGGRRQRNERIERPAAPGPVRLGSSRRQRFGVPPSRLGALSKALQCLPSLQTRQRATEGGALSGSQAAQQRVLPRYSKREEKRGPVVGAE